MFLNLGFEAQGLGAKGLRSTGPFTARLYTFAFVVARCPLRIQQPKGLPQVAIHVVAKFTWGLLTKEGSWDPRRHGGMMRGVLLKIT